MHIDQSILTPLLFISQLVMIVTLKMPKEPLVPIRGPFGEALDSVLRLNLFDFPGPGKLRCDVLFCT